MAVNEGATPQQHFEQLAEQFTAAVCTNNGSALAALFDPQGIYDDAFYGEFIGVEAIAAMLALWYRDGCDFRWQMYDCLSNGSLAYARYRFSYTSLHPRAKGERIVTEGSAQFQLRAGKISHYREHWEGTAILSMLKVGGEQMVSVARKQAQRLLADPALEGHLAP